MVRLERAHCCDLRGSPHVESEAVLPVCSQAEYSTHSEYSDAGSISGRLNHEHELIPHGDYKYAGWPIIYGKFPFRSKI